MQFCCLHFFPTQRNSLPVGIMRTDTYELLYLHLKYNKIMIKNQKVLGKIN